MNGTQVLRRPTAGSRTPQEVRDAVCLFGDGAASKQTRFWLLLVLAAGIATAANRYPLAGWCSEPAPAMRKPPRVS